VKEIKSIKARLEEDIPVHYHDDGEPRLTPLKLMEMQRLHKEALAYILLLEGDLVQAKMNAAAWEAACHALKEE